MPSPLPSTDDVQIAASNQTLNAFLGGRRPSWIQNTPKATGNKTTGDKPNRPTVRTVSGVKQAQSRTCTTPAAKDGDGVKDVAQDGQRASQNPDQQLPASAARDSALLPSPALTNEPSPALSTRHASPSEQTNNEQTEDSVETEPRAPEDSPTTTQPSPVATEHPPTVDVGMIQIDDGSEPRPNQATSEHVSPQAGSPTTEQASAAPTLTASPELQALASGSTNSATSSGKADAKPSSTKKRSRVSTSSGDNRAPRRPRIDMTHVGYKNPVDSSLNETLLNQWLDRLDQKVAASGGWSQLGPGIESPRFKYLRDAVLAGDGFYVFLHQLLCLWSVDLGRTHVAFPKLASTTIDTGFGHLMNILRSNSLLAHDVLVWFSGFPTPVDANGLTGSPAITDRIGDFLEAFVQNWEPLLNVTRIRQYPLMASELGPLLKCESRILQGTLFTVSRRIVGVVDRVAGTLNTFFCQDQKEEIHSNEEVRQGKLSVERRQFYRDERTKQYQIITAEAKRQLAAEDARRSPSVSAAATHLAQPQQVQTVPAAMPQPTSTANSPGQPPYMLPSRLVPPNIHMPIPTLPRAGSVQAGTGNQSPGLQGAPPHVLTQAYQHAAGQNPATYPAQVQGTPRQSNFQPPPPQRQTPPVSMAALPSPTNPQVMQSVSHSPPGYQQHLQQLQQAQHLQLTQQQQQPTQQQLQPTQQFQQYQQLYQVAPQPQRPQQVLPSQHLPQAQQVLPSQHLPQAQQTQHGHYIPQAHEPRHLASSTVPSMEGQSGMAHLPHHASQPVVPSTPTLPSNGVVEPGRVRYQNPQTVPRGVQRIPEHEYPNSPHDWVSHVSGAHLSTVRSPERRAAHNVPALARYYQYVSDIAFGPMKFPPQTGPRSLEFDVPSRNLAKISPASENECGIPVRRYSEGTLRYRLRVCMRPETENGVSPSDWVVCATHWPQEIYPALNNHALMVRRKQHFHHDLAVDLSDLLVKGLNDLRISFPKRPLNFKKGMTYFVAIEIVNTMSHDSMISMILRAPRISAEQTRAEIQRRLMPSESDDLVVEDNTFCINVADPFSFTMFKVPVRGASCKHLDCFDLETWLETRKGKVGGALDEPSMADNWKCPICFLDARPCNLRVDEFFVEVRKGLLEQGLDNTKKIVAAADGSWTAVPEEDDSEDESPVQTHRSLGEKTDQGKTPAPVDIIEIDDD